MRDTSKILRYAVYNALSGNITYGGTNIPVYDEKKKIHDKASVYVLLSTQQEVPGNDIQGVFDTESIIDLEICYKTGSEISKDVLDDVSNEVLQILLPTPTTIGIQQPSGFQIQNFRYSGSLTRTFEISQTESIVRKILKFSSTIIQQF